MLFFQFLKPTDMYAGSLFFSAVNFDLCFISKNKMHLRENIVVVEYDDM